MYVQLYMIILIVRDVTLGLMIDGTKRNAEIYFYFNFELPFHIFNLVAFLSWLQW